MELKHSPLLSQDFPSILLIVPYGIETWMPIPTPVDVGTFNRTLWN